MDENLNKTDEIKKIKLTCQRCKYVWEYNGKSKWYTSCPICKTTVNVKKKLDYPKKE